MFVGVSVCVCDCVCEAELQAEGKVAVLCLLCRWLLQEALRLYPSVPYFGRTTTEDAQIGECWQDRRRSGR